MLIDENARYSINDLIPFIKECIDSGKRVNMRVTGMSMYPLLRNRKDKVVLEKAEHIKKYDIVLHKRSEDVYILHRVIKKKGDVLTIAGDFEIQKEYPVNTSQVLARVVGFERKGVYHDVDELFFRIYACIWVAIFPLRLHAVRILRFLRRFCRVKK